MIAGLLLIFASYGLGIALVHWMYAIHVRGQDRKVIYVLITANNQSQIEWYIRYLSALSWLKGREIDIVVLDEGSTDETLDIVYRLALQCKPGVSVRSADETLDQVTREHTADAIVTLRLHNSQERALDCSIFRS